MATIEEAFEKTLFELIPQTRNLGIHIMQMEDTQLRVRGSYALNRNHLDIVFGGSIAAISITTAWSLLQHKIQQAGLTGSLVIKQQEIRFLLPVHSDFECVSTLPSAEDWPLFLEHYHQRGRAKLIVNAHIVCGTRITSTFQGVFVLYQPS
ncbi:YiiD C-terminal domain-containing protein [Methylophilus sp. OH31]|uniref:YiiD C-terminal domain-containing protein n=1 Tax=Methylophilus sp. OH31 TaxID=1387312 RepID=UPI0004667D4D|nr:YiiD C-terminal domain-containing protein [Methylophilus sp. OH31]